MTMSAEIMYETQIGIPVNSVSAWAITTASSEKNMNVKLA